MSTDTPVTYVPGDERDAIDPATRGIVHILRGLGLHQNTIAEMIGLSDAAVAKTLKRTRERIEAGEDPADVWESAIRPLVENDPDGGQS